MQDKSKKYLAPCIVLAYKRPLLSTIIRPLLDFGVTKLYVAFDGAKDHHTEQMQKLEIREIRKLAREFNAKVEILTRRRNLGLASAIPEALDWFFDHEEQGIIIEDDLKFGIDFLTFVSQKLQSLKNNHSIENISGNQFFPEIDHGNRFISTYPLVWGWGTWRDRWQNYRNSSSTRPSSTQMRRHVSGYWEIGYRRQQSGLIDSWAIPYARYQHFHNRKTFLPCQNLSSSVGNDDLATHSTDRDWYLGIDVSKNYCSELRHDPQSAFNSYIDAQLEKKIYNIKLRHRFVRIHVLISFLLSKKRRGE